jgi:hypothetical protein
MKKRISLPGRLVEDVPFDSLTRNQRRNIERRGRRALYDLPPDLIRRISQLAETYRLTNSMVAGALLIHGLRYIQDGNLDLSKLRIPSDSPRYDFRIDLMNLIKKWRIRT